MDRKCVAELVKGIPQRVYPVGRLDRESEGLLLMTNDGEFANAMMHPSRHVPKTYRVTVRPGITDSQLTSMAEGIIIDGRKTAPAEVRVLTQEPGRVVLEVVLHEGRNREIRKMCEALGIETARLKRTAFGPLRLGMLPAGKWRELTDEEMAHLRAAAGLQPTAGRVSRRPNGEIRRNRRGRAE
jgi:23S rRNA pseudouridine2605 synthase